MEAALRREPTKSSADEALLVQQAGAGDRDAFTVLVRRYENRVYNVCLRMIGDPDDAADVCQETFLKAYRSLAAFHGQSRFYTWLFRIAVNTALTHRRRKKLRLVGSFESPAEDGEPIDPLDEKTEQPIDACAAAERSAKVAAALAKLDASFRAVIVLRDVEGCDYECIAEILGVARGTVKSRLFRARASLRAVLEQEPPTRPDTDESMDTP